MGGRSILLFQFVCLLKKRIIADSFLTVSYSMLIIQPITTIAPMTIRIVRNMYFTSTYRYQ
jgi:hypothetical protein